MASPSGKHAILHRMMLDGNPCPFGLKARALLQQKGYAIDEHLLTTRDEVDALKSTLGVPTTPQTFINGARVGGYDDLRRHFGMPVADPSAPSYRPVAVLFAMAAAIALAFSWAAYGSVQWVQTAEGFIALAMCLLALQKLADIDSFTTMFLRYDLLAQRWVPYATLYPFAEAIAGLLMLAGVGMALSVPLALFIGGIGAVSVFKAVYLDRRTLKCACTGGNTSVPLGAISLTENLVMVAMALWMLAKPTVLGTA